MTKSSTDDYGNYPHYYGYRYKEKSQDQQYCPWGGESSGACTLRTIPAYYRHLDDRLRFFPAAEWFVGKRVLDVGCNAGSVSLQVARDMNARQVIGLDKDPALVKQAKHALSQGFSMCKPRKPNQRQQHADHGDDSIDDNEEDAMEQDVPRGGSLLGPRWELARVDHMSTAFGAPPTLQQQPPSPRSPDDGGRTSHIQANYFPLSMPLVYGWIPFCGDVPPAEVATAFPYNVHFYQADVLSTRSIQSLESTATAKAGSVDVVIWYVSRLALMGRREFWGWGGGGGDRGIVTLLLTSEASP